MKSTTKSWTMLKECLQIIGLWTLAFLFYIFMAYSMVDASNFASQDLTVFEFILFELWGALCLGFFMGTSLFLMQEYAYPHFFRRYGLLLTVTVQSLFFLIVCLASLLIVFELNKARHIRIDDLVVPTVDLKWLFSFTIYCLISHIFITLFLGFRRRLGKHYFKSLLRGNYRIPVIEYRVFMFLDMYSSTTTAEETGHYNYSLLLQECFSDLAEQLLDHEAEVYQYVGDEAVLTWKVNEDFDRSKCTKLYEAFSGRLLQKQQSYRERFGLLPRFKASVNEGLVTVAEVGQIKTEIAYHGDVLSTAARVRDLCNSYNSDLLLTDSFFDQLPSTVQMGYTAVETTLLRGKRKPVTVYKQKVGSE